MDPAAGECQSCSRLRLRRPSEGASASGWTSIITQNRSRDASLDGKVLFKRARVDVVTGGVSLVSAPSQPRIKGVKKKKKAIIRVAEVEEVKLQLQTGATALPPSLQPAFHYRKKKESDNFQMGSEGLISG